MNVGLTIASSVPSDISSVNYIFCLIPFYIELLLDLLCICAISSKWIIDSSEAEDVTYCSFYLH